MTLGTLVTLVRLVVEFFTYEAVWSASRALRVIFWTRAALMVGAFVMSLVLLQSALHWPRERELTRYEKETGEEHLITRHELGIVQDRNREVQAELRKGQADLNEAIQLLKQRQESFTQFQARIEDKLNIWTTVMGIGFSAIIAQLVGYLLNMRLRKEPFILRRTPDDPRRLEDEP